MQALRKTSMEMHAGEVETSRMLAHRPNLAHPKRAHAAMIRAVKADTRVLELQKLFFDESEKPLVTRQK